MYRYLSASEKNAIVNRILTGESVTKICRENQISRTIVYRWLDEYKKAKGKKRGDVFLSRRPRANNHWRHVPGAKEKVLKIIKDQPALSPLSISKKLRQSSGNRTLSSYGVYSLLKRLKLNRYHHRLAFSEAAILLPGQMRSSDSVSTKNDWTAELAHSFSSKLILRVLALSIFMLSIAVSIYSMRAIFMYLPYVVQSSKEVFDASGVRSFFARGITVLQKNKSTQHNDRTSGNISENINKSTSEIINKHQIPLDSSRLFDTSIFTQNQSFSWGALGLNTDKTIYLPNEPVHLSFGVLDQTGRTICYANLILKITDPQKSITFLSLRSGTIQMRPGCGSFTKEASDYSAAFQPKSVGLYTLELIAETKNGPHSEVSSFLVDTKRPFSIEHEAPSRIYPPTLYPVVLRVQANQDFKGEIRQLLASKFTVLPLSGMENYQIIERTASYSVVSWLVNLKRGQSIQLGYLLQAPIVSPAAYNLSGLVFISNDSLVFQEKTGWNVVADSVN